MHKIYKVKDMLMDELEVFASKEKLDQASLELIDKLSHSIKNLDKIIECAEKKEMEEEYGYDGGSMRGGSYEGSYARRGGGNSNASYERGGSRRSSRQSMARYSRDEDMYSNNDDLRMELQGLMNEAPNEHFRQRIQRMMANM